MKKVESNYIYQYYQAIQDGSEIVGKDIRLLYEMIIKGLENKSFFYDKRKADRAIKYIENFVHHHEGKLAPQLLKLELWQKAGISCIFGIVDENGNRQFREVVWIVGRKNGKTLIASGIANYSLYADGEYGARIYFAAPRLQQADLCFSAMWQSIIHEPELEEKTKKRKSDIYVSESNSSAAPLAFSSKRSDGFNISCCIADEISSWQGDAGLKMYEVIKSSFGSREQPLLVSITTAGYINDGIYDELIKRCTAVLNGNSKEKRLLPILYRIDDVDKWNDINELKKSMPNLGVSVSVDYMLEEIAIAEGSYSKKTEFLTKYCNIKQNSSTAWLPSKFIVGATDNNIRLEDFYKTYCVMGIDLSQTTDLTAVSVVIERDSKLNIFTRFFLPTNRIEEATQRDGIPYEKYIHQGILIPSGDSVIDYNDCFRWCVDLVEKYMIYPLWVGYDRYSATYLVQQMKAYGFHMDDVYQGDNLWNTMQTFEANLRDSKVNIEGDNQLLAMHLLDSAVKFNAERGRGRLVKIYPNAHIDGTASILDAMVMRDKYASDIGEQLKNKGR
ncbi:MAG: terminase large subunit [Clostridia bacterium]|nr:terminase large subunit [Clostridia bacterium]